MTDLPSQVWLLLLLGTPYAIGVVLVLMVQAVRLLRRIWAARTASSPAADAPHPPDAVASVFLVHGTFARHAAWTLPGSALRKAVERSVGGPVAFHNILWSGRNSVAARRAACDTLHQDLTRSLNRHPERPHIVIAHSHGGNIAMQALSRSFQLGERCHLICLSTPFLVLRPRPAEPLLQICSSLAPFVLGMLTFRALNIWLSPPTPGWWDLPLLLGAVALSALFAAVVFSSGERIAQKLTDEARRTAVPRRNVLLIRTIADEASMGISAVNLISRATQTLLLAPLSLLSSASEAVERTRSDLERGDWVFSWGAIGLLAGAYWTSNSAWAESSQIATPVVLLLLAAAALLLGIYVFALGGHVFVVSAAVIAISLALAPLLALLSLLAMATGREMALANPHVEFFAEPAPVGNWNLVVIGEPQTTVTGSKGPSLPGLQHSQSYLNPVALYTIERWIGERFASSASPEGAGIGAASPPPNA